jgi:hypothetical protein
MANEVISKGITLSYKNGTAGDFVELTNLSEIPELGGDVEAIEVTNLSDGAHRYVDGIKNYGDSLGFKFYYEKQQFETLNGLTGVIQWKVTLPDNTSCSFSGTSSIKLDGVGINAALTYTLNVKPNSEMIWA